MDLQKYYNEQLGQQMHIPGLLQARQKPSSQAPPNDRSGVQHMEGGTDDDIEVEKDDEGWYTAKREHLKTASHR
ncbi:hypothetical protein VNI00_009764 [Paramarasmius palmivorus]|uniref:Uncharacterized protein n=1 Tax=Paramarasmius palmivorus TaxID=297713 RepID=A0AAW0CMT8_9AGAR